MQTRKRAPAEKPRFLDIRLRVLPGELDVVKAAAAHRGLAFNTFMRLVSVGTARLVLQVPAEELVGKFLSPDMVLKREPGPAPQSVLE
jgi:hypothetical protein